MPKQFTTNLYNTDKKHLPAEYLDEFSTEHKLHSGGIPLSGTDNQGVCDPSYTKCTLCYIISPLVCLSHTRLIQEYFIGKHTVFMVIERKPKKFNFNFCTIIWKEVELLH